MNQETLGLLLRLQDRVERLETIETPGMMAYGAMYQDNTTTTVTIAATNTDYTVTGMTGGETNAMTFQNSRELLCSLAGHYLVTWGLSMRSGTGNQETEGSIYVNDTRQASTSSHNKLETASAEKVLNGTGIIVLAAGDVVTVRIQNQTATNNIVVTHGNVALHRIGV